MILILNIVRDRRVLNRELFHHDACFIFDLFWLNPPDSPWIVDVKGEQSLDFLDESEMNGHDGREIWPPMWHGGWRDGCQFGAAARRSAC